VKRTKSYHVSLIQALKDPREAAEYLNTVLGEGNEGMFLTALRKVAEAHGGIAKISRDIRRHKGNLYKMLSKHGNPEIHTLAHLLDRLGLRLAVTSKTSPTQTTCRAA